LYTARVVLQVLGVEDYGIYSVVGSVVGTIAILNTLLSVAISRFLSYEMGSGSGKRLHETYCAAMIGTLVIVFVIFVILETLGLYLLHGKLVIAEERIFAANVVFQLSVVTSIITIIQGVFTSCITAHEDFTFYAYMDILGAFLKLAIVFLLLVGHSDRLILYSALTLAVSIILYVIYYVYCRKKYDECSFELLVNWDILKRMLKYSGWSMYGNVCKTLNIQGGNVVLNTFFGTGVNAANGIAMAVQGTLVGFSFNIISAFRFQIVKSYAAKEFEHMVELIYKCGKYATAIFLVLAVPLFLEAEYVLGLWLGIVPEYTVDFLQFILVGTVFYLGCSIINIGIGASEKVALMNIINGTLYIAQLPIVYVLFRLGCPPPYLYISMVPVYVIILISSGLIMRTINPIYSITRYLVDSLLKNVLPVAIIAGFGYILIQVLQPCFVRLITVCIISIVVYGLYCYFILFAKNERASINDKILSLLRINK
jgi:Na+-driven multidrug efflux pump